MKSTKFRAAAMLLSSGVLFAASTTSCQLKDVSEILGTTDVSQDDVTATGTNVNATGVGALTPGTVIGVRP